METYTIKSFEEEKIKVTNSENELLIVNGVHTVLKSDEPLDEINKLGPEISPTDPAKGRIVFGENLKLITVSNFQIFG